MKIIFPIFLFIAIFAKIECFSVPSPIGKIKSLSITDCEVNGKAVKVVSKLYNLDDKGRKALDATVDLPNDMDATKAQFKLGVAKFDGRSWLEGIYEVEGELCSYVRKYIPALWDKIRAAVEPHMEDVCFAKKGLYKLNAFEAETKDINIPSILYGKFRLTFKVTDENNEEILCKVYEAESSI